MSFSRFRGHYLLHDRETPEDVDRLATIMAGKVGTNFDFFKRPQPPYQFKKDASAFESYQWIRKYFLPEVLTNSLIVGIGIGGLLAARLQEEFPTKWLSVVAINSPTMEDQIALLGNPARGMMLGRVAIYSSAYAPIVNNCDWSRLSLQAYDVPWLSHGIKNTKYGLAYLLTSYMQYENISSAVADFSGISASTELSKGASAD